VTVTLNSFF
jgi:hypothetical protein